MYFWIILETFFMEEDIRVKQKGKPFQERKRSVGKKMGYFTLDL